MSEARKGKSWLHDATPEQRAEFGARISAAMRQKSAEFREWVVTRYPDVSVSRNRRIPDGVREAWEDYKWWQQFAQ